MVNRFFIALTFICLISAAAFAETPTGDSPTSTATTVETNVKTAIPPSNPATTPTAEIPAEAAPAIAPAIADGATKAEVVEATTESKATEATAAPENAEEAWSIGQMMVDAFKSKNWGLAVGFLLMLLVFLLRKTPVLAKVPTKAVPWVAAALGVTGSVATGLSSGVIWYEALMHGVFLGAAATGMWEMVFKHISKKASA